MADHGELTVVRQELDPENSQRRLLHLSDGTIAGPFLALSLSQRNIHAGTVFTETVRQELLRTDTVSEARELSLGYLARRSRTETEVTRYLTRHSYHSSVAGEVVRWLREQGLLNDAELSERYVEQTLSSGTLRSKRELAQRMLSRGIPADQVRQALRADRYDESAGAFQDGRRKLAEIDRKLARDSVAGSDRERNQKRRELLAGYLYRKGYAGETVRTTLRRLLQDGDA
ncbi:MAG: regulatory protein RecX [Bacilli bacterium]